MLNCTFIGVNTAAYKQLVINVSKVCKKHTIESRLKHVNEIIHILDANVNSIPSLKIMPGNILLHNPSYYELENAILENLTKENLFRHEKNISTNRF